MNEKILIAGATVAIHVVVISLIVFIDGMDTPVADDPKTAHNMNIESSAKNQNSAGGSNRGAITKGRSERTYVVKPGDSLSRIANVIYGNSVHYKKIFEANKDRLKTPRSIRIGQELIMPAMN